MIIMSGGPVTGNSLPSLSDLIGVTAIVFVLLVGFLIVGYFFFTYINIIVPFFYNYFNKILLASIVIVSIVIIYKKFSNLKSSTKKKLLYELNHRIATDNGRVWFDKHGNFILTYNNKLSHNSLIWIRELSSWVDTRNRVYDKNNIKNYKIYKDEKFLNWYLKNGLELEKINRNNH
jgi:hypothetical protein